MSGICLSPTEDVPDMFLWFFPTLSKLPSLKLIVYFPTMFSAVFHLGSVVLLNAGTLMSSEPHTSDGNILTPGEVHTQAHRDTPDTGL